MRIGIIGYGKMGREIEAHAAAMGVRSIERFDIDTPLADARTDTFDVGIDFTTPDAVVGNVAWLARNGKHAVVGTTGWLSHLEEITGIVREHGIGLIYSPNFSIGVYLFQRLVRFAAGEYQAFTGFDVALHETHHRQKADAPSGTALRLGETILEEWHGKHALFTGSLVGNIPPDALHITSSRLGSVAGEHIMTIDSVSDTVVLKHTAKNRAGFALGALRAAQWIENKKGMYSLDDMMNDILRPPAVSSTNI